MVAYPAGHTNYKYIEVNIKTEVVINFWGVLEV